MRDLEGGLKKFQGFGYEIQESEREEERKRKITFWAFSEVKPGFINSKSDPKAENITLVKIWHT